MDIGNAVKMLRQRKNISQKELSSMCGISANALCSIESGNTFPSKSTITKICDALDIPASYLLLFSISENDIPENKRILYKTLCESIKEDLIQNL